MKTKIQSKPKKNKARSTSTASKTKAVRLSLRCAEAHTVSIAGNFNDWQPGPLQCDGAGGWSIELSLPPGDYEYLFVVDDRWMPDPACAEARPNPFGGKNSVLHVAEAGRRQAASIKQ